MTTTSKPAKPSDLPRLTEEQREQLDDAYSVTPAIQSDEAIAQRDSAAEYQQQAEAFLAANPPDYLSAALSQRHRQAQRAHAIVKLANEGLHQLEPGDDWSECSFALCAAIDILAELSLGLDLVVLKRDAARIEAEVDHA